MNEVDYAGRTPFISATVFGRKHAVGTLLQAYRYGSKDMVLLVDEATQKQAGRERYIELCELAVHAAVERSGTELVSGPGTRPGPATPRSKSHGGRER